MKSRLLENQLSRFGHRTLWELWLCSFLKKLVREQEHMKAIEENLREQRGLQIARAKENQIARIDSATYKVLSQSGNGEYVVCLSEDQWRCECPDHYFRGVKCKHIWAVEFSLRMREQVSRSLVIQPLDSLTCVF